jgi:hypothetical protein
LASAIQEPSKQEAAPAPKSILPTTNHLVTIMSNGWETNKKHHAFREALPTVGNLSVWQKNFCVQRNNA